MICERGEFDNGVEEDEAAGVNVGAARERTGGGCAIREAEERACSDWMLARENLTAGRDSVVDDAVAHVCGVDARRTVGEGVERPRPSVAGRGRRGVEDDSAAMILRRSSGCLSIQSVSQSWRE